MVIAGCWRGGEKGEILLNAYAVPAGGDGAVLGAHGGNSRTVMGM